MGQKDNRILDPVVIEGTAFLWKLLFTEQNLNCTGEDS